MTTTDQSRLMDHWAESILSTLVEIAPKIKEDPRNYDLMADFMLSATMGLNGFIAMGVTQDWATHMIGHELTALHGLTHGATLAIVFPRNLTHFASRKRARSCNTANGYGVSIVERQEERVSQAIEKTEQFFQSLGLSTASAKRRSAIRQSPRSRIASMNETPPSGRRRMVTGSVAREYWRAVNNVQLVETGRAPSLQYRQY